VREGPQRVERSAVPFRRLAWVVLGCTCLIAAGAWLAYERLLHYRRSAVEHLPAKVQFAARLDVEQVVLFEPVRRHLLPLLEQLPPAAPGSDRLGRLRREAGLNLGLDLREILVATAQQGRAWTVALGGLFPRQGVVSAIERLLESEGAAGWSRVGDALEFSPWGAALGQATDGVVLLASDRGTLESSLPSTERFKALGLAREGAGGAELDAAAIAPWLSFVGLPWARSIQHAGARLRLGGERLEVEARVTLQDPASARALGALAQRWTQPISQNAPLDPQADSAAPWALLARVDRVEVTENTVQLTSSVRARELDGMARDLAAWLQRQR
jgi:hypothetical protein